MKQWSFAQKVGPPGTEPLAVASGIKIQPTVMTEAPLSSQIKEQIQISA
jgi:hypothetical protein